MSLVASQSYRKLPVKPTRALLMPAKPTLFFETCQLNLPLF